MKTKSAALLLHPLVLGAIALYALNTFVLQPLFPSWVTGKLGDLAWVFFFPFMLTALLSVCLPEAPAFALSLAATGIGFALIKATPANAWLPLLARGPVAVVKDPGDLLALPALAGSASLWRRARPAPGHAHRAGLLLVPLVMGLMLADAAMPDFGLMHLQLHGHSLQACSNFGDYQSTDGGLSWSGITDQAGSPGCATQASGTTSVFDPADPRVRYRANGSAIERSVDGGATWQMEFSWQPLTQPERLYYQTVHSNFETPSGLPDDALADPATGNILFAMGTEGLLLRRADTGTYTWVTVGPYQKVEIGAGELVTGLLAGEWALALIGAGLAISLLTLRARRSVARAILTGVGFVGWLAVAWIFPPAFLLGSNYSAVFPLAGLLVTGLLALVLTIIACFQAGRRDRRLPWKLLLAGLGLAVLIILPYILWALNRLPQYQLAAGIATGLTAAAALGLWFWVPKWLPPKTPADPA